MVLKTLSTLRLSKDQPVPGGVWGHVSLQAGPPVPHSPHFPRGASSSSSGRSSQSHQKRPQTPAGGASQEWHSPLGGWEIMCRG